MLCVLYVFPYFTREVLREVEEARKPILLHTTWTNTECGISDAHICTCYIIFLSGMMMRLSGPLKSGQGIANIWRTTTRMNENAFLLTLVAGSTWAFGNSFPYTYIHIRMYPYGAEPAGGAGVCVEKTFRIPDISSRFQETRIWGKATTGKRTNEDRVKKGKKNFLLVSSLFFPSFFLSHILGYFFIREDGESMFRDFRLVQMPRMERVSLR